MTIKKILAVLLCVAMLAVSFAGCGNDPAPKGDDEYEIAVVVKILGIPFFNVLEEGVKEAAEDLGVVVLLIQVGLGEPVALSSRDGGTASAVGGAIQRARQSVTPLARSPRLN